MEKHIQYHVVGGLMWISAGLFSGTAGGVSAVAAIIGTLFFVLGILTALGIKIQFHADDEDDKPPQEPLI